MRRWLVLAALLLCPAFAQGACSLRRLATVPLEIVGTTILVPAAVNGIEGRFILDTGAALTAVTPEAVARFGLALDEWTATTMRGVGGIERRRNANPRSLTLGGLPLLRRNSIARDSTLRVVTLPHAEIGGGRVDGLLGRDFLSAFDLDLDPAHLSLGLYDVRGCDGRFLPWTDDYVSVPVETPAGYALMVPVEVDGVPLRALLDSGASRSMVAAPGMARLGLGLDRLDNDPREVVAGMGPRTVTMWRHRFRTLRIGNDTAAAPVLLVAPVMLTPIADLLLGADWLLGRRVWLSWSTRRIFATR